MAYRLFIQSVWMVFANFTDVLKLTLIPFLAYTFTDLAVSYALTGTFDWDGGALRLGGVTIGAQPDNQLAQSPVQIFGGLLSLIIYVPLAAWLAIGWHRFVLAEEYPSGFVPKWQSGLTFPYVKAVCIVFLVMVVALALVGAAAAVFAGFLGTPAAVVIGLVGGLALLVFNVRISLTLPAVSVGNFGFGLKEALAHTKGYGLTILGSIVLFFILVIALLLLVGIPGFLVAAVIPGLISFVELGLEWFFLILGISFLTTLYGVTVEGRALS